MLEKSPVTKKWYTVESLSLEEKVQLGFDEAVVKELKEVPTEQKKSRAKKGKKEVDKGDE